MNQDVSLAEGRRQTIKHVTSPSWVWGPLGSPVPAPLSCCHIHRPTMGILGMPKQYTTMPIMETLMFIQVALAEKVI